MKTVEDISYEKLIQQLIARAKKLKKYYNLTYTEICKEYYQTDLYTARNRTANIGRILEGKVGVTLATIQGINDAIDKVVETRRQKLTELRKKYGLEDE